MKRISHSHNPTINQLSNISFNLREKFNRTFFVEVTGRSYDHEEPKSILSPQISVLPGLDGRICTVKYFSSWKELLSWYLKAMKEGLPSE